MTMSRAEPMTRTELLAVLGLVAAAVLLITWRWVGFQGHDQASYLTASLDWMTQFPFVGTTHWALRYPIVLPTAAASKTSSAGFASSKTWTSSSLPA